MRPPPKYDHTPNAYLRIELDRTWGGSRHTWSEGSRGPVDRKLPSVLDEIERRHERAKVLLQEHHRAEALYVQAEDWRRAAPVRVYRMSGEALTAGVEEHSMDGTTVRVFNPAKTVADCFKYRNKIGLDVALEAFRETVRSRKATRDAIMKCAQVDRVSKIVRPYLEAME